MALDQTNKINTAVPGSQERALVAQFNQLLTTLRAIFVAYDADSGISLTTATASLDAGPKKIADETGTIITA